MYKRQKDIRVAAWSPTIAYSGTNHATADYCHRHGQIFKAIADNTNVEPSDDLSKTNRHDGTWYYLYDHDGQGDPDDFNVDGGHVRIAAGVATGNGTSGSSSLTVGDGIDRGPNIKQRLADAIKAESDLGDSNTHMVIRQVDGGVATMRRVQIDENGFLRAI